MSRPVVDRVILRAAYDLAGERQERFTDVFDGDTLETELARLRVRQRARRLLGDVSPEALEGAVSELLEP